MSVAGDIYSSGLRGTLHGVSSKTNIRASTKTGTGESMVSRSKAFDRKGSLEEACSKAEDLLSIRDHIRIEGE